MSIYINNSKNLIQFPHSPNDLYSTHYRPGFSHLGQGITYTVQEDGGIKVQGTVTGSTYSFYIFAWYKYNFPNVGTYTLGLYGEDNPKVELEIRAEKNGVENYRRLLKPNSSITRTFTEDETIQRFAIIVNGEGTTVDAVYYPMFNEGETLSSYEPFNKLTKVKAYINNSKNLIPFPYDGTTKSSGITFSINSDGTIVANGQNDGTSKSVYYLIRNGLIFPAGTYTVDANIPDGYIYITLVIEGKYYFVTNKNSLSLSFEKSTVISAMYIQVEENAPYIFNNYKFEIMMNKGLTSETYEPYNKLTKVKPYIAKRNPKNLIPFPYSFDDKTYRGITRKKNEDGSITFMGTATADIYLSIAQYKIEEFPIGTYYLSGGKYSANILLIADAYLNETWEKNLSWGNGEVTIDFNGYNTVYIFVYIKKDITVNYTVYPIFNEGETAEPYFTLE